MTHHADINDAVRKTTNPKSPLQMFYHWESTTPHQVYLRQPKNLEWTEYTWSQVGDAVRRLASFLRSLELPAASRIAIWSSNSKDWPIVDLAIMLAGHISVPLYPGQDIPSARYILEHSEAALIFVGAFDLYEQADQAIPASVPRVAMLGCKVPCQYSVEDILETFPPFTESPEPLPGDTLTIIYTSGTTGNPKGVEHAHSTPGYTLPDLIEGGRMVVGNTRFFSFLPMAHAGERIIVEMASLYCNGQVSFSEGLATFADELRSVQPHIFFSVPRLWIKFKEGIDAKIPPAAQASLSPEMKAGIIHNLGLSEARCVITGAAPCPPTVQNWFIDLGVILRDGYGMTENFIHGCFWTHNDHPKPGCVGRQGSEVEMKLSDAGEVLFRSKGLMKGYYKEPEKTAEVIVDGWYHTGDSGRIDEDGCLWVTGRISEVFKTSKGKFVRPTDLESRFGRCPLLSQYCVLGHGLDQPAVLVSLSESGLSLDREALQEELGRVLDVINSELPPWERMPQMFVTKQEWSIANGLLTPTMKLRRKQIEARYRPWIESNLKQGQVIFE
ncbi:long-chain acyl-CoA synthetase [Pseudomonas pohangensis]|uniref:Long-chain acyl-CoA synthetase n=1 Tax=Pseudomonas pohangensis TaxID=364197 RepID=A0A1H2FA10_9PSED|nr:AMP-binding protein [Pseudomonas pohangensis]SDU04177.1 long-chain acyl-CoA synthetase [Pseudomonas pohangensis]